MPNKVEKTKQAVDDLSRAQTVWSTLPEPVRATVWGVAYSIGMFITGKMSNLTPAALYGSSVCAFAVGALVYARVQEVRQRRTATVIDVEPTEEPKSSTLADLADKGATISFSAEPSDTSKLEWFGKPRVELLTMAWHETNAREKALWAVMLDLRNVNHHQSATARSVFADIVFSDGLEHTTAAPFKGEGKRGFNIAPGEPATLIVAAAVVTDQKGVPLLFWRDERVNWTPNGYLLHVGTLTGRKEYIATINVRYNHGHLTRTLRIEPEETGEPPKVTEIEHG